MTGRNRRAAKLRRTPDVRRVQLRLASRAVDGLYSREVATIERGDPGDAETFRKCDQAGVSAANWEVRVALDELGNAR